MKKILLAALLLAPFPAIAQSDYAITWTIVGSIGTNQYTTLKLDLNEGTRYLSVDGVLETSSNTATPTTGTCMLLTSGNVSCNLLAGPVYFVVEITPTLAGTIQLKDNYTGNPISSAALQFVSIR